MGGPIGYPTSLTYLIIRFIWQFYGFLVIRQHFKNKRDGMGDARNDKSSEIPAYVTA